MSESHTLTAIQRVRELRAKGYSLRNIAALLQTEGVPPPGRRRTWNHTAVRWCLAQRGHPTARAPLPATQTDATEIAHAVTASLEAGEARQEVQARVHEQQQIALRKVLATETDRLAWLVERQEDQAATWLLGWSQAHWQGLLIGVALTLFLGAVGLLGYWLFGPPTTLRAELSLHRQLWAVTTEAERQRIQTRLQQQREFDAQQREGKSPLPSAVCRRAGYGGQVEPCRPS